MSMGTSKIFSSAGCVQELFISLPIYSYNFPVMKICYYWIISIIIHNIHNYL